MRYMRSIFEKTAICRPVIFLRQMTITKEDLFRLSLDVNEFSNPDYGTAQKFSKKTYQAKMKRRRGKLEPGEIPDLMKWWPIDPPEKRQPVAHLSDIAPNPIAA